jgi:cytochrome c553
MTVVPRVNLGWCVTVCCAVALACALSSSAACSGEPSGGLPLGSSTGTGTDGGGGNADAFKAKQMFDELEATLLKQCDGCHLKNGPADTPFLGDPATKNPADATYKVITSWPQFVVKDWKKSRLLTHSGSSEHKGTKPSAALVAQLEAWLAQEAVAVKDVSVEKKPTLPPFKPIVPGFNAVYLSALSADMQGMALTFQAEQLTASTLSLTDIEIHPTTKKGLKVGHPLFTVFPAGSVEGQPDPIDSFSNVTMELKPGETKPLGPGTLILANWKEGARLSIAFEVLQAVDPNAGTGGAGGGGSSTGGCKAVDPFKSDATPALAPCVGCHGGNNANATNAVNMKDLTADPAKACTQILNRVNVKEPAKSQLFVTTNPGGNATHPFKFQGNAGNFNSFQTSVTKWIQAESKAM